MHILLWFTAFVNQNRPFSIIQEKSNHICVIPTFMVQWQTKILLFLYIFQTADKLTLIMHIFIWFTAFGNQEIIFLALLSAKSSLQYYSKKKILTMYGTHFL